jgi:serine/threonine protein kinase
LPGTVLSGKHRVERVIGQGATGIVLEATDLALHRRVAVKLMSPARARSEEAQKRFIREARAVASLSSEHITRLIDIGELHDGTPYLVMEYLVGATLEHVLLAEGPPPIDVAVDWVLQALDGIAEAHRQGFVHRDLKPENLFLCERPGRPPIVKVLDFGAVKDLVTKGTRLTRTGSTMGSPAYMPPEQVRADEIDQRVDVWAMGVTLYELLTGVLPFGSDSVPQTLAAILRDEPLPLRSHRPDASAELEAVIACALSKDPARRYASAAELLGALSMVRAKMPRTTRMTKTVHLGQNLQFGRPDSFSDTSEMNAFADPDPSRIRSRLVVSGRRFSPKPRRSEVHASPTMLIVVALAAALVLGGLGGFALTRRVPQSSANATPAGSSSTTTPATTTRAAAPRRVEK